MLDWNDRESIREYIKQNNIKDIIQLNTSIKKMMGAMIEQEFCKCCKATF